MGSSAEYQKQWRAKNPGYARDWLRKARAKNPGVIRKNNLRANYGLTIEQYDEMLAKQNGRCGGCGDLPSPRLCVDHDHKTGAVRGLLCNLCNVALGLLKDDPSRIRGLGVYIGTRTPK